MEQNNLLHKHLESVSSQATRIRQATESTASTGVAESDANDNADTKLSELRSVVGYLRKEKEIVDLQLELSKQEATRMKSQIDHLQVTLNETRRTLTEVCISSLLKGVNSLSVSGTRESGRICSV